MAPARSVSPAQPLRNHKPFPLTAPTRELPLLGQHGVLDQRAMLRHRAPRAYSLLEVVLAAGICSSALVPALALLRDGMSLGDNIDKRHLMLLYGVSKMEEQLAIVAASWTTGTVNGDFAADGHPNIRYTVTRSDNPASGGITNRLMSVSVTAYSDDDGDDTMDANEMRTTVTTKIGKLISYETKAAS
jgi:hypothetical protein